MRPMDKEKGAKYMSKKGALLLGGLLFFCQAFFSQPALAEHQPAALAQRGIVEGFYGQPWSQKQRLDMLDFMGRQGLNLYVYAPKDDPYHREKWREAYPPAKLQQLQQLIDRAKARQIEFVFAVSPGLDVHLTGEAREEDLQALLAKLSVLYGKGVRQFAIFFDDIKNKDGQGQAAFLNAVDQRFIKQKPDVKPLFTVPTEYFSEDMWEPKGTIKPYSKNFAGALAKDIVVLYTGSGVVCEGVTEQNILAVEKLYRRPVAVWWNYPVNDYRQGKLALGPVHGVAAAAAKHMAAFLMNPMEKPELSKIALATGAEFAQAPFAYEEEKAWEKALGQQYGKLAPAMQVLAEHSQRMENTWAHTGRADAPLVRQHMDAFWQDVNKGQPASQAARLLTKDFAAMAKAAQELKRLPPNVWTEGHKQITLLGQLAQADQTALQLIQVKQAGQKARTILYRQQLLAQKAALPKEAVAVLSEKVALSFIYEALRYAK